ncbi:MAG: anaerobic ribonucleoside-triphosphate reductase activating protein [Oscillospiraceae bacterium]
MEYQLEVAGYNKESIVDGKGIRYTVFMQGCPHHCVGCHNPATHPFTGGTVADIDEIASEVILNPLIKGITLSGGEPFSQAKALIPLVNKIRASNKDVWAYSGYTYEQLDSGICEASQELLGLVDVLVDGKFELEKRDLTLFFRGSSNQRFIDFNQTRNQGKIILLDL